MYEFINRNIGNDHKMLIFRNGVQSIRNFRF